MEPPLPPQPLQFILNRSRWFFVAVIALTIPVVFFIGRVELDSRVSSFVDENSKEYADYQKYANIFRSDQAIFLLVENRLPASDPRIYVDFPEVLQALSGMDEVVSVESLYFITPFFSELIPGLEGPWTEKGLRELRECAPSVERFISQDLKTLGLVVTLNSPYSEGSALIGLIERMCRIVTEGFYGKPACHAVGLSILQAAFERQNLRSTLQFGLVSFLVGTLTALYIFKTLRVSLVIMVSYLLAITWTLGIMGIVGIPLSLATGVCFGFIMVICTTTVMHIFTQYYEMSTVSEDRRICLQCAYAVVTRPCLMCALTTAAGFLTLVLSPLEMVRHAGLVTATGSLIGFLMASITAFFLIQRFSVPGLDIQTRIQGDILSRFTSAMGRWGPERPWSVMVCSCLFTGLMLFGILHIEQGDLDLNTLSEGTDESRYLKLMNERLAPIETFSLVFEPLSGSSPSSHFWQTLDRLEQELLSAKQVTRIESILDVSRRIASFFPTGTIRPEEVRDHLLNGLGYEDLVAHLLDADRGWVRLNIYLPEDGANERMQSITAVLSQAREAVSGLARVEVFGYQALMGDQIRDLSTAQLKSLALALLIITFLMTLQLGSVALGLISLIPNALPLAAIFGLMGLLKIPLDPLTIFAAVISFGLSVDDSIHYLTQLKRELSHSGLSLRACQHKAYNMTARALISTTAVLSFSCVGLFFSPFTHVRSIGILISGASVVALMGDLVVMPALILIWRPLGRALRNPHHA